ncbi:MAG TPA: MgtC/SapB family protein [Geomonas sp.]|nr:MgtC/SapB family protein [Geomonas sp.]
MGPELSLALVSRLLLASLLGGMIGLEREIHGRPAGFRTHLLVSLGACLFVITSVEFYYLFGNFTGSTPVGVDPGRVAAQVVTGIGFLGAGAIIRDRASIRGLTTAACLWVAAALGVACGVGLFKLAVAVTGISLGSLLLLKQVEKKLSRDSYLHVKIWGEDLNDFAAQVRQAMSSLGIDIIDAGYEKDVLHQHLLIEFQAKLTRKDGPGELLATLSELEGGQAGQDRVSNHAASAATIWRKKGEPRCRN